MHTPPDKPHPNSLRAKAKHAYGREMLTTRQCTERFGVPAWYLQKFSLAYALENYKKRSKKNYFSFGGVTRDCKDWANAVGMGPSGFRELVYATEKDYECDRDTAMIIAIKHRVTLKRGDASCRHEQARKHGLIRKTIPKLRAHQKSSSS